MTAADTAFFRAKRIVITGATGFIGSSLVRWLRRADCRIIRVLRAGPIPTAGDPAPGSGPARISDVRGDIRERRVWEEVLDGADLVYHLAAQTSARSADNSPFEDLEQNVLPMLRLLEECRKQRRPPAIVFASTVTIAGIPDRLPVDESFPDRPMTMYDLHKKMAEDYLKLFVRRGLARGLSLRLANVYGPGPLSTKGDRGVLNQMIARALEDRPLTVYGKGDRLRDYVYVDDAVAAFAAAARHMDNLNGRHFVIGTGRGHTVQEAIRLVAKRVAALTRRRVEMQNVEPPSPLPPIEDRDFVAESRRFRAATRWKASISLLQGLDRTIIAGAGDSA